MPTRCVKQPDSAEDQSKVALQPGKNVVVQNVVVHLTAVRLYLQFLAQRTLPTANDGLCLRRKP
jgi:hypothetical protein